jgi:hypothetical protein
MRTEEEATFATTMRIPIRTRQKIDLFIKRHKETTGYSLTLTTIFRLFLEEGLKNRGITDHVLELELAKESGKKEPT